MVAWWTCLGAAAAGVSLVACAAEPAPGARAPGSPARAPAPAIASAPAPAAQAPNAPLDLAATDGSTCALLAAGQVVCWQHGWDPFVPVDVSAPVRLEAPERDGWIVERGRLRRRSAPTAATATRVTIVRDALGRALECELSPAGDVECSEEGKPRARVATEARAIWGGARLCVQARDGLLGCARFQPGTLDAGALTPIASYSSAVRVQVGVGIGCAEDANRPLECWRWDQEWRQPSDPLDWRLVRETLRPPVAIAVRDPKRIAVGAHHACALQGDGRIVCWGHVVRTSAETAPARIELPELEQVTEIDAGWEHACAVQRGDVWCWGANDRGQSGAPDAVLVERPRAVDGVSEVTEIALGARHACALTAQGDVYCWGDNAMGQLGRAATPSGRPARVPGLGKVAAIRAGGALSCALTRRAEVKCWGALRDVKRASPTPATIAELRGARDLAVDGGTVCATNGTGVRCLHHRSWLANPRAPKTERVLDRESVLALAGRCALLGSGKVACFDWWLVPELDQPESLRVEMVRGLAGARALHARGTAGCARLADDSTRCFRLRIQPVVDDSEPPKRVAESHTRLEDLAAGGGFECVLSDAGALGCWGRMQPSRGAPFLEVPVEATLAPAPRAGPP